MVSHFPTAPVSNPVPDLYTPFKNNNTAQMVGPTVKDAKATYAASITSLVQLTNNGVISFLPYTQGNSGANSAAAWSTIGAFPAIKSSSPTSTSAGANSTASGFSTVQASSATGKSTGTQSAGGSASTNGGNSLRHYSRALSAIFALAAVACLI